MYTRLHVCKASLALPVWYAYVQVPRCTFFLSVTTAQQPGWFVMRPPVGALVNWTPFL